MAADVPTQTKQTQSALTPQAALDMLKQGNERFVKGEMAQRNLMSQVKATASGQYPHAVVLGCIDSRVPTEIVLDQGIGDIFSVRIGGNFVNTDILGSMEFATAVVGSKVLVVLGHSSCGAVEGACDGVELGNLTHLLSNISPAIYAVKGHEGQRNSKNAQFVAEVTTENVHQTVANILERSPVMKERVEKGELLVVGAMYDMKTGIVHWLDGPNAASR